MRRQIHSFVTAVFLAALVGFLFLPGIAAAQQQPSAGVVTGIQGLRWFNVEVFGETAHAGRATTYSLR